MPKDVQELARKNFKLLQQDLHHPSLQFTQIGRVWSARVGLNHRALAKQDGNDYVWVWIGSHAAYDHLIK